MLLADPALEMSVLFWNLVPIGMILGVVFLVFGYEYFARRFLQRVKSEFELRRNPGPGDVFLRYHTYHGFLAWFSQTEHQAYLPPEQARIWLGRLLRFNLTWGLLSYGTLVIPILAIGNYISQRRSISQQELESFYSRNRSQAELDSSHRK